jgi:ABC-type nitrate/sulfonate/bicarbonate transport system substrate-binding protein
MRTRRTVAILVLIASLVFPLTASAAADRVRAAYVAIMNFAPLYGAIERGFMKEQNIEVQMEKMASGSEAMAFLAQGTLDVGGMGIQASAFTAARDMVRRLLLRS